MPRKTALIIGNSAYQDPALAQLKAPDADVRGLTDILSHPDQGQFDEVVPLINASEARTRLAIATFFARAQSDDMLLLYFSGHGVLDDKGRLYLAASDTQRDLPQATAISAAFVTDAMDSSRSRRQVLILDCCHSGAFARGARSPGEAKAITAATFEGAGYGRAVLTATDATQYAWEGEAIMGTAENSVFTHCMLEGLKTGAADTNQDGEITLEELYTYIYGEVVKRTPKQTPRKWSYNQEGEFVIARNPHPLTPPTIPLPDDLQHSVDDVRPWVREGALLELERLLLGNAPSLAAAAQIALTKLKDDDSRRISVTAANLLARYEAQRQAAGAARAAAQQARRAEQEAARAEAERRKQAQAALVEQQRLEREAQAQAAHEKQAQAALVEQQRLEREELEKAEREQQAQAALAEQQRLEREEQEKAEREAQAQAALAERQRLEREEQEKAEREAQAQAALAERQRLEREEQEKAALAAQQRLEREQQMIADREKNIQARLAARQRAEREQQAQAAQAARAPAAPPSAADSTSPLPVVRPPVVRQPAPPARGPIAAATITAGGLGQLLAAPWVLVVLLGLAWALSRGLAQFVFPNDSYPGRLPWLLNWLAGGAAGGYLLGLLMRRLEPNWQARHTRQIAAGWVVAWLLGYIWIQAVNQYLADLDWGDLYPAASVVLTGAAGAVGGHWLGRTWRSARPGLAAATVAPLTGGWALAWGLATVVVILVVPDDTWVTAWIWGGLAGGLAGGAVTHWVAGRVRAQPATPPAPRSEALRPQLTRPQWVGPLALMALGWSLGWVIGSTYDWLKVEVLAGYLKGLSTVLDLVGVALLVVSGGAFTLRALSRLAPALGGPPSARLLRLWIAAAGLSVMVALVAHALLSELNLNVPDVLVGALSPVLTAGLGAYALARQWQHLHPDLLDRGVWRVAGAWAAAFGFIYLLFEGFLTPTFGLDPLGWALAGALAGLLAGAATLAVFTRPAPAPSAGST